MLKVIFVISVCRVYLPSYAPCGSRYQQYIKAYSWNFVILLFSTYLELYFSS